MTFKKLYGHYEFLVIRFTLTMSLEAFMSLMNWVFKPYLHIFVFIFINDILVYCQSEEEYMVRLRIMLQTIRDRQLFANFSKYEF